MTSYYFFTSRNRFLTLVVFALLMTPEIAISPPPPCSPRTDPKPVQGDDPSGLYHYYSDTDLVPNYKDYYCYERAIRLLVDQKSPIEFQWYLRKKRQKSKLILAGILQFKKDPLRRTRKIQKPPVESESGIWSGAIDPFETPALAAKGTEVASLPLVDAAHLSYYIKSQRKEIIVALESTVTKTDKEFVYTYSLSVRAAEGIAIEWSETFVEWSPVMTKEFLFWTERTLGYNPMVRVADISVFRFREQPELMVQFKSIQAPISGDGRFAIRDGAGKMLTGFDTTVYVPKF